MVNHTKKLGMRMLSAEERKTKFLPYYAGKAYSARRDAIAKRISRKIEENRKRKVERMRYAQENNISYHLVTNAMAGIV